MHSHARTITQSITLSHMHTHTQVTRESLAAADETKIKLPVTLEVSTVVHAPTCARSRNPRSQVAHKLTELVQTPAGSNFLAKVKSQMTGNETPEELDEVLDAHARVHTHARTRTYPHARIRNVRRSRTRRPTRCSSSSCSQSTTRLSCPSRAKE
jgi:hypothetical protein